MIRLGTAPSPSNEEEEVGDSERVDPKYEVDVPDIDPKLEFQVYSIFALFLSNMNDCYEWWGEILVSEFIDCY
jgi:hypothetical protein